MILDDPEWKKLVNIRADGVQGLEYDIMIVDVTLGRKAGFLGLRNRSVVANSRSGSFNIWTIDRLHLLNAKEGTPTVWESRRRFRPCSGKSWMPKRKDSPGERLDVTRNAANSAAAAAAAAAAVKLGHRAAGEAAEAVRVLTESFRQVHALASPPWVEDGSSIRRRSHDLLHSAMKAEAWDRVTEVCSLRSK
ncbi:hypothetical protein PV08_03873 [Exophiala spinifera]|uniref:Uncharacterized protein n=1 Tax=Exophiala spinifera TaxID=91928 RepID=A0A0D2BDI4_9EURO|nr:uncharacterized protein PV08_03873 [Exophiala spinifera]KIW16685.1 hypothetical protein PV08_03873 [Exophiala spinifera]